MVAAVHGPMAAVPFGVVPPVAGRMHAMMASAVFPMHAVMMGMMAVMVNGTMGAGTCMHAFRMSVHGAMRVGKDRTGSQQEESGQ